MNAEPPLRELIEHVEAYVLDAEDAALARALEWCDATQPAPAPVLAALERLRGDRARKARAIVAIRARLGLSVVPGAPCSPQPLR
ncbi:MAG: hypothetical protein AB7N70_22720 [Dehalococcoidia bacterium]